MAKASEIATNVWAGPTPDPLVNPDEAKFVRDTFDLEIHTSDTANIPMPFMLNKATRDVRFGRQHLDFPSSGSLMPPSDDGTQIDDLVCTVRWMYALANPGPVAVSGGTNEESRKARKIIILCPDGYTESSLLILAYFMYAEGVPAHEAWLKLHCDRKRNFFAYHTDVMFLRSVEKRLLHESPVEHAVRLSRQVSPAWFSAMDGSLPSRITPYMYLGNLNHANNPDMLWALGIRRILSIGEPFHWNRSDVERIGEKNIMYIGQVHDNGIDSLTQEFDGCLDFIRALPSCLYFGLRLFG